MAQKGYRRTIIIDMNYNAVKDGAAAVQRQMRLLDNEFRSTSEAMKLSGSEGDKLANKQDYLTRKIELQTRKVEELYKKYEEAKTKGDEHSKSVTDAANKYNYAESELEKLKNQLTLTNEEFLRLGAETKLEEVSKNVEETSNKIKVLDSEYSKSKTTVGKLSDEQASLTKKIELQSEYLNGLTQKLEASKALYDENSSEVADLTIEYNDAEKALAEYSERLNKVNQDLEGSKTGFGKMATGLEEFQNKANDAGIDLQNLGNSMQKVGAAWTVGVTAPIVAGGMKSVEAAKSFEDAFTGVIKTVDGTEQQIKALREGFLNMSKEIPVSASRLAEIGEAAGQLGVKTENIERFTRVMADMGEATNLSATEAAESLAQFANITGMSQNNFDRLGSAIVSLGNNMATTERDIVNFGQRLAGAGNQVGLTEDQIMGIAATFSSLGIEAEAGGTAVSKVLLDMSMAVASGGDDLKAFAEVAGMSGRQFKDAFEKDAASTFGVFLEGLRKMQEQGRNVAGVLEDLGYKEVRVRDALLRGSSAHELYADALDISAKAWEENTALAKEAETRYGTFTSKIEMLKNQFEYIFIKLGGPILDFLIDFVELSKPFIEILASAAALFAELPEPIQKIIIALLGFIAVIGPIVVILGTFLKNLKEITGTFSSIGKGASAVKEGFSKIGTEALSLKQKILAVVAALAILAALWIVISGKTNLLSNVANDIGQMMGNIQGKEKTLRSQPRYAYASGTNYHPGGKAIVGEEGPEIVELPRGSKVYTAQKTRQMLSDNSGGEQTTNNYYMQLDLSKFKSFAELESFLGTFKQSQRQTAHGV